MSAAPAIVLSPRDRWLADAHLSVGASELAAILGEDWRRGPFSIWASKVEKKLDEAERSWLVFGRRVEGAILDGYADKTGLVVRHNAADKLERFYHPQQPRLSATPDGLVEPRLKTVEAKAVAYAKREDWEADPPVAFQIQVQAQTACTGYLAGDLIALIGGVYITDPITIYPDAVFMDLALEAVNKFWWHVENNIAPPVDGKPETRNTIRRLWPADNGQAKVLDGGTQKLVEAWDQSQMKRRAAELVEETLENEIRVRMGPSVIGYLPDNSSVVLRGPKRILRRYFPRQLKTAVNAAFKEK